VTAKVAASDDPDNTDLYGGIAASLLSGIVAALLFAVLGRSNEVPATR